MSYNCDTWKTKKLEKLRIPIASLYKHLREDWHPTRTDNPDGTVSFTSGCEPQITGTIDGEFINVTSIEVRGEGSGTSMNWIIEPALADSTGELIATCVWEGGDSVNRIVVKDGDVRWENIEL